jgi:hypothetical protein
MAFPQTPLPIKVELQVGSTWTDVTTDVRADQQIRIIRGRSDEGQTVDTTRCAFTLDNNSGKYSPRNASGPYYGQIGRNTPCRVSVLTGTPYLDLTGSNSDYAETADVAALDITGDLDVRLDASFANWLPPILSLTSGSVEMIGKFSGTGQKSWWLGSRNGLLYFEWSADGTNSLSASSTLPPVIPGSGRLAVRVTLDVDNGASGNTVRFYTAANLDAPWTQLGAAVTQAGTTSVFSSTSPVRIGNATGFTFAQPFGRVHSAEIRNGLWGTVVAQPYFSAQSVGVTSFSDSPGRTWTMNGASSITNRQTRFVGEVSTWAPRWETRFDVVTQIEASGILRRLTQGASPVRSAMSRELTNPSRTGIVGYWPMEDEAGATSFASALNGQAAMPVPSSGVTLAAFSDWVSSAPLPTYSFGTTKVRLAPYTATNFIFARFFVQVPAGGVSGTDRLFGFTTTGTARTWALTINTVGALSLQAYDADGTQLFTSAFGLFAINGLPRHIGIELTQNGANIDWALLVYEIDKTTLINAVSTALAGTLNSYTAGAATEVRVGQDGLLNGTAVGHVVMASSSTSYLSTQGAMIGWREETTNGRIQRLGNEEGFPAYGVSVSDQEMGPQGRSTLVDLLREAEAADEGILCEGRSYLGLRFRDHVSLYNQTAALTLNYTGSDGLVTPLEPTDDDQQVRNDITVARTDGSSSRVTLDTGTLSTLSPPNGVGRYTDSVTLNLADDTQTLDHAGWRLHTGTWDETRYPVVRVVLSKAPASLETAAAVDIGDRIQITNPPAWLPLDTIDLMVQGYSETLDQFNWSLDFNCTPCGPWDVTWAGDASTASSPREFRFTDPDGSALAEDLTTTETDIDVLTTSGQVWTPNVSDTPFDWRVSGEVMTVTAPGGLLNTNPFFNADISGWTGSNCTITRSTTYVHPHSRAQASLRVVPDGVSSTHSPVCTITDVGTITPGANYVASMWVFSVNGWTDFRPTVDWKDSTGASISTSSGTAQVVSASVWTYLTATYTAPAGASRAVVRARLGGTASTSDIWYAWGIRITRTTSSWLYDAFGRTVSSSWGTSDSGMTWATVGGGSASDYSVNGAAAVQVLSTLDTSRRTSVTAIHPDADIYCDITTSALATGDSLYGAVTARMLDASNMYMCRAEFTTSNTIVVTVRKMIADVQTQLGVTYTLPFTHVAGSFIRVRFQVRGTALRAKAWRVGDQEPGAWHIDTTDSAITAANQIGTRSIRSTGNTNAATVAIQYDNVEVINPQTYTVTRSANRVVKAQTSGAAVALAYPAYTAL